MAIHQSEKAFFNLLKNSKPKLDNPPSLSEVRTITKELFEKYSGPAANVPFNEISISARDGEDIRIRIFNPDITGPTLFFLPGNAFLFDLFECNAVAASRIAHFGKFKVILVDHRLMPENPWPILINDIEDVMTSLYQNTHLYNIDSKSIYLFGICSGAHAATFVASKKQDKFHLQKLILLNGLFDLSFSQNSHGSFEEKDEMISRTACFWWLDHYKLSQTDAKKPDRSILYAKNFSNFPETTIILAEYDGFRSDSEALYSLLQQHHVAVTKIIIPKQTHNTMILRDAMKDGPDPAEIIANEVWSHFHP